MGRPFTIQIEDENKIYELKQKLCLKTKIEVVREGLKLLEEKLRKDEQREQWLRAAEMVAQQEFSGGMRRGVQ